MSEAEHEWEHLERDGIRLATRCRQCGKYPIELLTVNQSTPPCAPVDFDRREWRPQPTWPTYP